jgi:hypothetical protein
MWKRPGLGLGLVLLLILPDGCEDRGSYIPEPIDITPPAAINSLEAIASGDSTVTLRWLAAGDDPTSGIAAKYEIRHQCREQVDPWWASAEFDLEVSSRAAYWGLFETVTISGLIPMERYYFAVRAADEVPNWSGMSNVAEVLVEPVDVSGNWSGYVWGLFSNDLRQDPIDLGLWYSGPGGNLTGTYRLLDWSGFIQSGSITGDEVSLIIRLQLWDRDFWFSGTVSGREIGGRCSMRSTSTGEVLKSGEWRVWPEE